MTGGSRLGGDHPAGLSRAPRAAGLDLSLGRARASSGGVGERPTVRFPTAGREAVGLFVRQLILFGGVMHRGKEANDTKGNRATAGTTPIVAKAIRAASLLGLPAALAALLFVATSFALAAEGPTGPTGPTAPT